MGLFQKWFSPQSSPRKMAAAEAQQQAMQNEQLAIQRKQLAMAEEQTKKAEEKLDAINAQDLARLRARSGGIRALMADYSVREGSTLGSASTLGSNV